MTTEMQVQLEEAIDALLEELEYQDKLPRRTEDSEAKDVAGFATLLDVYVRKLQDAWANEQGNEPALHQLRKVAAIAIRGMLYCGVRRRFE